MASAFLQHIEKKRAGIRLPALLDLSASLRQRTSLTPRKSSRASGLPRSASASEDGTTAACEGYLGSFGSFALLRPHLRERLSRRRRRHGWRLRLSSAACWLPNPSVVRRPNPAALCACIETRRCFHAIARIDRRRTSRRDGARYMRREASRCN